MKITEFIAITLIPTFLGVFCISCNADSPPSAPAEAAAPAVWVNQSAAVTGEIPEGWNRASVPEPGLFFHHPGAPGHVLSVQKLTENTGTHPLRILKNAIKKHPYFSEFTYENKWSAPISKVWAPAFHASYHYLDAPAVRHGHLVATADGYYEIAYHAPGQLHPEGLTGYERLLASISIIQHE